MYVNHTYVKNAFLKLSLNKNLICDILCILHFIIFVLLLLFKELLCIYLYITERKMSKKEGGKEQDITSLYRELNNLKQKEEYEKAIKVRNVDA